MPRNPFLNLDWRKWFDQMLPQTLQVATWLLYINGAFAILDWIDRSDIYGIWRWYGGIGGVIAPFACLSYVAAGLLMANGRRLGWQLGIAASLSPVALRALLKFQHETGLPLSWVLTQRNLVSFLFEAALVALLLHPMSRTHAARWFR
ncbi:MAG: hypothetical protein ACKORY_04160 [Actinomycetota bacterium]